MTTRYSKRHLRRAAEVASADRVWLHRSGLIVTCAPPNWLVARSFDFTFVVPFAATSLAKNICAAFGNFAIRFARPTAVARYNGFKRLWLAVAESESDSPGVVNLREGELARWWRDRARVYGQDQFERDSKPTSAKVDIQNTWTVLDELASCGLLIDIPPIEIPRNLHLTKVPRPSLVELTADKAPSREEKNALVRHLRSIGVPVDDEDAQRFIEMIAGILTAEEREDPKKAVQRYSGKASEYLARLAKAAETRFLRWKGHYEEGQRLLHCADHRVVAAFPGGRLPTERSSPDVRKYFPLAHPAEATANFLALMAANFSGRVPSSEAIEKPWRDRHIRMVSRLGGRHNLDAMLSLHREAVAAAAILYVIDTGANVATAISLETEFERATSNPGLVEFFAVKSRARYAAIHDVLPVDDPGRQISTVKALRAVAEMTASRRHLLPQQQNSLFVFTYFDRPSVANAEFLSHQLRYLLKEAGLPTRWTLSGVRAAVGVVDTLDGTGTLNGLRRKLNHGRSSNATTTAYALRWPIRKQLELEMAKYQKQFEAGIASNLEGALTWLHRDATEAERLLQQAQRTGLGFLCAASSKPAQGETRTHPPCSKVGECSNCSARVFILDEQSLAEAMATNLSIKANLDRLQAESAQRFDDFWIDLFAFTTVAVEEAKRGPFAYLVPRAKRLADEWISKGFDVTDLRPW